MIWKQPETNAFDVAKRVVHKALSTSFFYGWKSSKDAMDKLKEEAEEVASSGSEEEEAREIGDALFVIARFCVTVGINPEVELIRAARRFEERLDVSSKLLSAAGKDPSTATIEAWEVAWGLAKILQGSDLDGLGALARKGAAASAEEAGK